MNDKRFSFIAAITTIAATVIAATGITWFSSGIQHIPGVVKSSIESKNVSVVIPLHYMYGSRIVRLSKASPIPPPSSSPIPPPSSSPLSSARLSQLHAISTIARTGRPSIVISTQRSDITIFPQIIKNETHHIFSTNVRPQNSISKMTSNGRSSANSLGSSNASFIPERIAYVAPTFTTAAYNNRFYVFYKLEENVPHDVNVTNHLSLLTSRVIKLPPQQIKHAFLGVMSNLQLITDQDVDNSSIFIHKSGNNSSSQSINKYDVLILGHQEYVTQKEYDNLKHFVGNGGILILLDGNVFYAQVNYDRHHHSITLIKGHGWAFNGESAWKSVSERWAKETSQWIGSNFLPCVCPVTFAHDPFEYKHHEEQYITNHNDTILTNYDATLITKQHVNYKPVIATYELHYKKGRVIVLGLYSDDILNNIKFDRYFDTLLKQPTFKQHAISYQR